MTVHENELAIPEGISFSPEQISEIRAFLHAISQEKIPYYLKRAIVLLAFSLDQRGSYEPVNTHSGMIMAFNNLIEDLSVKTPESDEEYLSVANIIIQNAFLRLQSGELSIEKFMQAVQAANQIYQNGSNP